MGEDDSHNSSTDPGAQWTFYGKVATVVNHAIHRINVGSHSSRTAAVTESRLAAGFGEELNHSLSGNVHTVTKHLCLSP